MRKLFSILALLVVFVIPARANKTNYVAQIATGTGDGLTPGNRMAIATVNSSWPLSPGDILSLGGTISNQINVTGSGTSGAWEVIRFESGANMTSTNWGDPGKGTAAIQFNNNRYIQIDGGANGYINSTANGTGIYTNYGCAIGGNLYFGLINNVRITNCYTKVKGVFDDTREGYPFNLSGSSITVSNCIVSDGDCGISYSPNDTIQSNWFVLGNTILNCNHSSQIGMGNTMCYLTNVVFASNYLDHWDVWDDPIDSSQIHLDGFWLWNNTHDPSSFITGIQIYDNVFGAYVGIRTTSACAAYLYNAPYQCGNTFIYNNTFLCAYPGSWGGGFIGWGSGSNTFILNNSFFATLTNGTFYGGRVVLGASPAYLYNNLCYYMSGIQVDTGTSNSVSIDNSGTTTAYNLGTYFTNIWSDFNIWYDQGNGNEQFSTEYDQAPNGVSWVSGSLYSLANWQTWNNNNRGMPTPIWNTAHADPHSTTNQVSFVGSTYQPSSSDTTARLAGTNLTTLANAYNIPAILTDAAGNARPSSGNWTIGAFQAASGAPVAPVFTSQPSSQIGVTNSILTFNWTASASPDASTIYYAVMLTNNGAILSPYGPANYWSSNSPVAQSNWIWTLATNDAQTIVTSAPVLMQWTNGIGIRAVPSFTTQPTSMVSLTNNILFFSWGLTNNGDSSGIYAQMQFTNNGSAASAFSPHMYFGTNSLTVQSNWVWVVATNDFGSVTSSAVLMQWTNGILPVITQQPATSIGLTNPAGTTVSFTAAANYAQSEQWYQTNGSTAPSTSFTLTTSSAVAQTNGFFLVLSNASGFTTSAVALFITTNSIGLPVITANPSTVQNITNTTFTLTAGAAGTGPLTFQWYNTNGWVATPSISTTLSTNVTATGTNYYAMVASNGAGSVTSTPAGILATNGLPPGPSPGPLLMKMKAR